MIILLFLYLCWEAFCSAASHALENMEEGLVLWARRLSDCSHGTIPLTAAYTQGRDGAGARSRTP